MYLAMLWPQNYSPLGNLGASAMVASIPVILLLALLGYFHARAHLAALAGLGAALVIAVVVYRMPLSLTLASSFYGAAFGLFPIGWIVLNAIFVYNLSVETGGFQVIQGQVAGLSADRRMQCLLIAFSFGAFIEGFAGFGAPVAITGALMIGLGFRPLEAAKLALIGNTAPVAFGSVGIPIITLAKVTGLDLHALSSMVGRQLPFFSFLIPFWLVAAQTGWRGMLGVWPACLVTGASFALVQFLVSNLHGPWLVDLASALASILSLVVLLRFWRPKKATGDAEVPEPQVQQDKRLAGPGGVAAWAPWIALTVMVFASSLPASKKALNDWFAPKVPVPGLHLAVQKQPPVVAKPEAEPAEFTFNLLSATGTSLLCAGLVAGAFLGLRPRQLALIYWRTVLRVRLSLLTIALMLALGFTTRFSGSDCTMGLALAATGPLFPFFSPLLGWLGVALTGSDTSSNVLFGNLQQVTAGQIHVSPILTAAANSSGGVMGKMIDAQSIVVASTATGGSSDSPDAGTILRSVFWHSLALAVLMGFLVLFQAYCWQSLIPSP
jgi:lactate permease